MSRDFDDILNDCLERLANGEDIQQCVSRYPEHEAELVPLLSIAGTTMRAAASASYTPEAKSRGLNRLTRALADRDAPHRRRVPFIGRLVAKPIALGLVAASLMVLAAGGATLASANSVPGEPLYWIKTTKENISMKLPRSDISRAQAHARRANVRGHEMRRLIAKGNIQGAELLAARMRRHLNESAMYAGVLIPVDHIEMPARPMRLKVGRRSLELRAILEDDGRLLRVELIRLAREAPPGQQRKIRRLLRGSDLRYRVLIEAIEPRESPGSLPFWRVESAVSTHR